jgi:putative transposase
VSDQMIPIEEPLADEQVAKDLVERARSEGAQLVGPGGLLTGLTKTVLETALEVEMEDHLGYAKHAPAGRDRGNSRNGSRSKTVLTEVGEVELDVPRDREGSFEPQIVKKRQRRLSGVDELVISLAAKGLTTGEIAAHFADVYGAQVSRDTISRITDRVIEEMVAWQTRPLDEVYPVVFIDAIQVKIRDGQVANRPVYTVVGVTVDGMREIIGLWIGDGGEGAKYWHQVLGEIRNRGVKDVCILVCAGLRGLVESVADIWPLAIVQTCVLHLVRNTFRYAGKQHWYELARDLRLVYTAATEQAARERFDELADKWGDRYPAIIRLWHNAWAEFVPFLAYDAEIRKVLYSTDENVKYARAASVVESEWVRVTPDRRAGYGDGSPAAQVCRMAASELLPGGGTRTRFDRFFGLPVGDELSICDLGLFGDGVFLGADLFVPVGGGAALAAAA